MSKKTYGIYAIRNIHSSKLYIGSTILSFQKRWALHRSELRRGAHSNRHLQHAWNQDGEASF
ncbi:GIY-YIG nuclease family protein, partial [Salmonella enterica]|uniref:GIY-YIG nuclease family protein n=1 Tax=Salmonella enterica TaxID=28901 RepID=UPI003D28CE79